MPYFLQALSLPVELYFLAIVYFRFAYYLWPSTYLRRLHAEVLLLFQLLNLLEMVFVSDALLIEIFLLLDVLHSFEILYFLVVLY